VGRSEEPSLSLAEWLVLSLVCEGTTHGFAIAALAGPDGGIGRAWRLPRPVVYRALGRLRDAGLIAETGVEHSVHGPARTLVEATTNGASAAERWLGRPVAHVRDVRSELLVKLALLDRAGRDPSGLLAAQRRTLEPIVAALRDARDRARGFDRTLAAWRYETAVATVAFLDELLTTAG
jgi:PadR family transcriptional regulator AphA